MVYRGKPSRGCQCCKTRRIKCDEARPECGQCKKSARECPGYPDEFDLIFRNETAAVKRRAHKNDHSSRDRTSPSTSRSSCSPIEGLSPNSASGQPSPNTQVVANVSRAPVLTADGIDDTSSQSLVRGRIFERALSDSTLPFFDVTYDSPTFFSSCSIPSELDYSIDAAATAFFFRNYVYLPQNSGSGRGFLEYLIPMYGRAASDSPLQLVTHAVALSSLGNYPGNKRLKTNASRTYGKALTAVNEALKNPEQRTSDEVLLTILMFSLYEAVQGQLKAALVGPAEGSSPDSAWTSHIDGAVTLAKLRGDDWKTEESVGIFRAIRTGMLTRAIQCSSPIEEFPSPKGWLCDDHMEQNHANRLSILSINLPKIRRYAQDVMSMEPGLDKDIELHSLIQEALQIDGDLQGWFLSLPESWGHRTVRVQLTEPENPYMAPDWMGPVHVYDDLFIANILNDYRCSRIFCHKIVLLATDAFSTQEACAEIAPTKRDASYMARSMVDDICSSVPFHLDISLQPAQSRSVGQELHAAEATGAYFLIWPLFVNKDFEILPLNQRQWIMGRLFSIGSNFGLDSAEIMAMAQRNVLNNSPSLS